MRNSVMRRMTVLATAGAVAVAVGMISFTFGRTFTVREPVAIPAKALAPELVTSTIDSRPIPAQPSAPPEAFPPPTGPAAFRTVPLFYCTACRTEWDKRQEAERKKEAAKRRAWYARRKERRAPLAPPTSCATCGTQFKGKRKDAGTVRNSVCEAIMMEGKGASYGYRERPAGPTFSWA